MLSSRQIRIFAAIVFSLGLHAGLLYIGFPWSAVRLGTDVVRPHRVTITMAPRRIRAVVPPVVVDKKPMVEEELKPGPRWPESASVLKNKAFPVETLPEPEFQKRVDVVVQEIPAPEVHSDPEPMPVREKKVASPVADPVSDHMVSPVRTIVKARPLYRKNPLPRYPAQARRRHYQGTALLEVLVDQQGRAAELRLFESSGHKILDRAALAAVQGWLFEPGRNRGRAVAMWVRVPIRFVLQ